jgi:hypothetical protein
MQSGAIGSKIRPRQASLGGVFYRRLGLRDIRSRRRLGHCTRQSRLCIPLAITRLRALLGEMS